MTAIQATQSKDSGTAPSSIIMGVALEYTDGF